MAGLIGRRTPDALVGAGRPKGMNAGAKAHGPVAYKTVTQSKHSANALREATAA